MSKSESNERGSCDETWTMRQEGRGLVAPSRKASCRCGRCRLYRWYPPLLLASTTLTAVFCVLYLTKPVFLGEPSMKVRDAGDDAPRKHLIAQVEAGEAESAESAATEEIQPGLDPGLDPGLVMFPAEPRIVDPVVAALSQPEPLDVLDVAPTLETVMEPSALATVPTPVPVVEPSEPMPVRVSIARRNTEPPSLVPGGFQPLDIEPTDKPLFQSLTKADLARLDRKKAVREDGAEEESETNPAGEPAGPENEAEQGAAEPEDALVADAATEEADEAMEDALVADAATEEADGHEPGVAASEEPEPDPEDGPVLRASLIGEFYLDEEPDENEEQARFNTAMLWKGSDS